MRKTITLTVNNQTHGLTVATNRTLVEVIRQELGLTGTKIGCGQGDCGACTVIMDGRPVNSCLVLAVQADGSHITTIEGIETDQSLHPLQEAFVEKGAIQCGFCSPGMILTGKNLLESNPEADEGEIRDAISGNLCRCSGYQKIVEAIRSLSKSHENRSPA
ncbi:MAG: (2Fe-2S)-binding protein [Proteobacteria bacterium]|nr:(2Fe-2S)-binding protein [Desulfobacterales bacterium]MBL6967308.1 (2Fe-2S)-binding protein [Desulfobacteraceae bacterium]MBU0735366.1 (2Fe-2S)-binding protein [Pseudomonadota bacterium]MBL7102676.1 (2Fe-2S)-binding protein [Desulfobacteraceae bacterium]MBL7171278.1 (2Fe-2S)-binding protein [Desulfobacteraceae bacterium]